MILMYTVSQNAEFLDNTVSHICKYRHNLNIYIYIYIYIYMLNVEGYG